MCKVIGDSCAIPEKPSLIFRLNDNGQGPELLRQVFLEQGWTEHDEEVHEEHEWNMWWRTSRFRTGEYENIYPWQRLNHYPKSTAITKKDALARNLKRMRCVHGGNVFNFSPLSFNLPNDYTKFVKTYGTLRQKPDGKTPLWICKPADLSRGRGIFIFRDLSELLYDFNAVIQQYVDNPLLIGGYKFDLRIYVAVTSFHPLTIYIHEEGIVRFGTEKFDLNSTKNVFAHLTNTSINKHSPGYTMYKERVGPGCKWTLSQLRHYFMANNINDRMLWRRIVNIVVLTILIQAPQVPKTDNCFELYGFDILVDENLKPWLLEVNFSPSLSSDCLADVMAKKPMLHDLLTLMNYSSQDVQRECKETHFQCPGGYCIPTYLLNNGEKDCMGGEDESIPTDNFTCPGFNEIRDLNAMQFKNLVGLMHLNLSGNLITRYLDSSFRLLSEQAALVSLKTLTMVDTDTELLASDTFQLMTELTSLDLRKNPLRYVSKDAFEGLVKLSVLRTDNARVCCDLFHQNTKIKECDAPSDELSSCDDLLTSDFFRVFLWVFSVLTVTGNAGVLIFRLCLEKEGTSLAYRALVVSLSMSDFLMGVYLAIIGLADAQFRGLYVSREPEWRESNVCKAAGFLALVSSEVSALGLCLITLDRFFVIKFPFSSVLRLTKPSAIVACGATWAVGVTLAAFPLFQADWRFYEQNGICLPLPITQRPFKGQDYAFGVFIVFNFVLFLVIGAGQAFIFYNIHSSSRATMKGERKQETVIARRLFLIVCTDFCCWFPIGLMGLLAAHGFPIPGVVNVFAAVFVLPINSALNPFLYTINTLLERRAKNVEQKRTEKTMSRLRVELRSWPSDKVEELIQFCLRTNLVPKNHKLEESGVSTFGREN
nr:hypothetical protein BaRGS_001324 [Batillaria attramentaria]